MNLCSLRVRALAWLGFPVAVACSSPPGDATGPERETDGSETAAASGSTSTPTASADAAEDATSEAGTSDSDGDTTSATNADDESGGACDEGISRSCYPGPEQTQGVGPCRAGTSVCTDGEFGPCRGWVGPQPDLCETEADEDCDGLSPTCVGDQLWEAFVAADDAAFCRAFESATGEILCVGRAEATTLALSGGLSAELDAPQTLFVARFDADGSDAGIEPYLGTTSPAQDISFRDATIDSTGGLYVLHRVTDDGGQAAIVLSHIDADGALAWSHEMDLSTGNGCFGSQAFNLEYSAFDDSVALTGCFNAQQPQGEFEFPADSLVGDNNSQFIAKFDGAGNQVFARLVSSDTSATESAMTVLTDGTIVFIGSSTVVGQWVLGETASQASQIFGHLSAAGDIVEIEHVSYPFPVSVDVAAHPNGTYWSLRHRLAGEMWLEERGPTGVVLSSTVEQDWPAKFESIDIGADGSLVATFEMDGPIDFGEVTVSPSPAPSDIGVVVMDPSMQPPSVQWGVGLARGAAFGNALRVSAAANGGLLATVNAEAGDIGQGAARYPAETPTGTRIATIQGL